MVTLSSLRFSWNMEISLLINLFLLFNPFSLSLPILDRYSKSEFELALSVDSVRPPLLVINPLNMDGE